MKAPTSDQLRRRIDSGDTGEKVGFPDPAAAPLGTDDEAAGTPPTEAQREKAWRDAPSLKQRQRRLGLLLYLIVAGVVGVALVIVASVGAGQG